PRPTWPAGGCAAEDVLLFIVLFGFEGRGTGLLLVLVDVVGAVPQIVAVVLVGHPATVFFVVTIVRRATTATIPQIVDVSITIGEAILLAQFVTPRHARLLRGCNDQRLMLANGRREGCTTYAHSDATLTRRASASFNALVYLARRFVKNCKSE